MPTWFEKAAYNSGIALINDQKRQFRDGPLGYDPYAKENKDNPNIPNKKDQVGKSLGFGTNDRGATLPGAMSESGEKSSPDSNITNSLTSGYTEDEIMDEDLSGKKYPRTDLTGPPRWESSNYGAQHQTDGLNSMNFDLSPDYAPQDLVRENYSKFMNKIQNPYTSKKVRNQTINLV